MRHLLLIPLLGASLAWAEPGTLIKDSELRAKPFNDAAVAATLKTKTVVDIKTRKGAWAEVSTADGRSGWVRLLNVRTGSGQKSAAGVGALASLFKTGSSGSTVSTGVKGLSAEELAAAQPNEAELAKLKQNSVSSKDAQQSAKQAKLATQNIAYLLPGAAK